PIPRTVLAWDHASREAILLIIYMAKIVHPDVFADWDMKTEIVNFYKEACGKIVSFDEAGRILKCLPPL
ncbi:MAG: iron(III) dicitrate-biding protein, partial [Spirochaetia bacterium]|nr:iron(III) dicitrate-biding protein [Spirochaetia bacterium]